MKLKKLVIHSLPGIRPGFEMGEFRPGLNVIVGPNASGKTSICQAVRRLLWPHRAPDPYLFASIYSEWSYNQESFTLEVKDGHLVPFASQAGIWPLKHLPEEPFVSCFSMTIDELFDGKDQEFAKKISSEIAGGYDLEGAKKYFVPSIAPRTAMKEWEEAVARYEHYRRTEHTLREEGGELPFLDRAIREAEGASRFVAILDKILHLKTIKEKIVGMEHSLHLFPSQLILEKVKRSDWEQYQQWVERRTLLLQDMASLQGKQKSLEQSVGKWREVVLPEGELDRQIGVIQTLQRLQDQKNEIGSKMDKLESVVKEHQRLLGIGSDQELEKIRAEGLDALEESWEALERLESRIERAKEEVRLNESTLSFSSELFLQGVHWLTTLASYPKGAAWALGIGSAITTLWVSTIMYVLNEGIRFAFFWAFIPVAFLWFQLFKRYVKQRELRSLYNASGLPPLKDWTSSSLLQQLNYLVKEWGSARYAEIQWQRKKEVEKWLDSTLQQRETLYLALKERALAAGIGSLPDCRYRFAGYIRMLHRDWIQLKEIEIEFQRISDSLTDAWKLWDCFADRFQEKKSSDIYELVRIHAEIKTRMNGLSSLRQLEVELESKKKTLDDLQSKMDALLFKTDCGEDPDQLRRLVEQLGEYEELKNHLKLLKFEFESLFLELGPERSAQIEEEWTSLEMEKKSWLEKAERLQELSEKKGSLKARIQEMEKATEGESLLAVQKEKFGILREACRDFVKKELIDWLAAEAQKDFQRDCQPPVLQQAVDWFQRFTRNKFRLEAPSNGTGNIVYEVIETSTRERKHLDQLSRGTRMQLLMSVRFAFAVQSERKGLVLPIFLDEVLANTDPERFQAVAEVIGELIKKGRQIFYLTCNSEDASRWLQCCPEAYLMDLSKVRGEQAFLASPLPLFKEASEVPKPLGQTVEEYARRLQLPSLRIDEPVEGVSIHYLVDSAEDLYRLLQGGVETYGHFKHARPHWIEKGFPRGGPSMARRGELLERFFDLATRGRGKPLSRKVLMEGGLTKIFLDDLWGLAQELGSDAKKLIEYLEDKNKKDPRKKGLRVETRENLKFYLIKSGVLDEREQLTKAEIRYELFPFMIEEEDRAFIERLLAL